MAKTIESCVPTTNTSTSHNGNSTQQPSCLIKREAVAQTSALPENDNLPHHVRSRSSQDRYWNEAVKFYETVGSDTVTPDIIESTDEDDDDSSCDDDSSHNTNIKKLTTSTRSSSFGHLLTPQRTRSTPTFVYHGIEANPPEITKCGVNRGNPAQIHRKAWLEVSDTKHRYGKNLRLYYRHWESLGFPTNNFFDWLDSKGQSEGNPLPSIDACPRDVLDNDTVLYITNPEVTKRYALEFRSETDGRCRVVDINGELVSTGPDGWIFVIRDGVFYGAEKVNDCIGRKRFHHSSFFGGKAVAAAGIFITDEEGYLTHVYPHSGHYRPGEADLQMALLFLYDHGIDLSTFQVDTQQLIRVNRKDSTNKKKKVDSLHLRRADNVAHFLSHKARSQLWLPNIGRYV